MTDYSELSDMPARSAQRKLIEQHNALEAQAKEIEELEAMRKRDMDCIKRASIRIAELEAENKRLRKALKPFDERLKVLETVRNAAKYATSTDIDIVHLRNARAALKGEN